MVNRLLRLSGVTLVILALAALASPALAGVLVVMTEKARDDGNHAERAEMRIEHDRMHVETKGPDSRKGFIFRGDRQVMWAIDYDERTYLEMTRKDLERMRSQMDATLAEMQKQLAEQLKDLPPEQRQMMEQMLKDRMPQAAPGPGPEEKIVYTKVAAGQRVGRWTCDRYEGRIGGEKVEEVCAAGWKEIGLKPADLEVWRELADFFKGLDPEGGKGFPVPGSADWEREQGYPGVPVLGITYHDGKPESEWRIEDIRQGSFPASIFEVPAGFQKEALPGG